MIQLKTYRQQLSSLTGISWVTDTAPTKARDKQLSSLPLYTLLGFDTAHTRMISDTESHLDMITTPLLCPQSY